MRNLGPTIILAIVALTLVGGVCGLALADPILLVGLPPVLLAIAAVVRAVGAPRGPGSD